MEKKRGFGKLTPEQHREMCSKGGKAAHAKGTAHRFNSEEAKRAADKATELRAKKKAEKAQIEQPVPPQEDIEKAS